MRVIDGHAFLGRSIYLEQNPESLVVEMDRLGVDIAVVVAPPPGPFYAKTNDFVMQATSKFKGRLAPVYRVNPHIDGEVERAEISLREGGFLGLQLDPTNDGYGVGSPIMEPFAEIARKRKAPVYIHSGDSIFCPPEAVADFASRFGDVNFVTNISRGAYRAARDLDNLYFTTRPFPILSLRRGYAESFNMDRLIFASDAPLGSLEIELKSVDLAGLDRETKEKILGGNIRSIMDV